MTDSTMDGRVEVSAQVQRFLESKGFQRAITLLIVINAATLGLETSPSVMAAAGPLLKALDHAILSVFVVELLAKMAVYRLRFPRDPWNIFDFCIVGIALVPAAGNLSVLRALRVLRVLRLISMVPSMRTVVQGLLAAIPGMGSVVALLILVFYVFAVMATNMFGGDFPEWFGTVGASFFSLFQIMTLESWSMGIVRPVMKAYPAAWAFFVPFILMTSFVVLNLFIAVIVSTMQGQRDAELAAEGGSAESLRTEAELRRLQNEIGELKALLLKERHG
jgi:voltage-gated sodium channel